MPEKPCYCVQAPVDDCPTHGRLAAFSITADDLRVSYRSFFGHEYVPVEAEHLPLKSGQPPPFVYPLHSYVPLDEEHLPLDVLAEKGESLREHREALERLEVMAHEPRAASKGKTMQGLSGCMDGYMDAMALTVCEYEDAVYPRPFATYGRLHFYRLPPSLSTRYRHRDFDGKVLSERGFVEWMEDVMELRDDGYLHAHQVFRVCLVPVRSLRPRGDVILAVLNNFFCRSDHAHCSPDLSERVLRDTREDDDPRFDGWG